MPAAPNDLCGVGANAGYALLRTIIEGAAPRRQLNLIGHSFGCKVVCSLLAEILKDGATVQLPAATEVNIVLLQAAFDDDDLEPGNIYGAIAAGIPNARLLVTTSELDSALGTFYPEAEWLNLFHNAGHRRVALGFGGPTPAVAHAFGPMQQIAVGPGFNGSALPAHGAARLIVADLTPLHAAPSSAAFNEPLAGHHGDIFHDEIYALIAAFV